MSIDERKNDESFRKPEVVSDESIKDLPHPKTDAEDAEQVKGGVLSQRMRLE